MSIGNIKEQFLYNRLPDAVITGDERGYIEAVCSGIQDRLEDVRSYAKNLDNFWVPGALPTPTNNVVLVDLTSSQGKSYTRSLDIVASTPSASSNTLAQWAAGQLGLDLDAVSNVRYGYDALRAVDEDTLSRLASTLGTLLYQTDLLSTVSTVSAAQVSLVNTWFPRLKIKGTAQSFDVLGRVLGFDDVRITPLWTRLNPHVPSDVGAAVNDPDFSAVPEYFPRQQTGPFYDPFNYRDGPFYSWTGTASNGTNNTSFYSQTVTGHNPWVDVVILGSLAGTNVPAIHNGTVTHPASGSYALSGGAAYTKAYVDPPLSSVRFQAVAAGEDFNGVYVHVDTSGTLAHITVTDRLSAIKYRSSYFDIGLTADMDKVEDVFGSRGASTNKDLKANATLTPDGTAVSPYRPWISGSLVVSKTETDWLISTGSIASTWSARHEADPGAGDRQLNMDAVVAAGIQVTQAFDEVRAATRLPRSSQSGFLIDNDVCYAPYTNRTDLFTTSLGAVYYSGSSAFTPTGGYTADVALILPAVHGVAWLGYASSAYIVYAAYNLAPYVLLGTVAAASTGTISYYDPVNYVTATYNVTTTSGVPVVTGVGATLTGGTIAVQSETNPLAEHVRRYAVTDQKTSYEFSGTWDFSTGSYAFDTSNFAGVVAKADWSLTTTESVRSEPSAVVKSTGTEGQTSKLFTCLGRPEDEEDAGLIYEVADDFPWLREVTVGGELVELDTYYSGTEIGIQTLDESTAFNDQTGVDIDVYGITSPNTPHPRVLWEPRTTTKAGYRPGYLAIAFKGTPKSLSTLTAAETALVRPSIGASKGDTETDYDVLFAPGYGLYHTGLAQGVLVADLPKFFGEHHARGLQHWLAFNEHVDDNLTVVDHSFTASDTSLTGLSYASRTWDDDRGWYLNVSNSQVLTSESRDILDDVTASFWIKLTTAPTVESVIVDMSPIQFTLRPGGLVSAYAANASGSTRVGTAYVGDGAWHFVYIRKNLSDATFGVGTLSLSSAENNVSADYASGNPDSANLLSVKAYDGASYGIHDLRVWNVYKTAAEMDLVRYHAPCTTPCTYRLGFIYTLDREDKYGLKVLPSGWVCPAALPAWHRRTRQGLVLRYDSMGSYSGETRYKEVGYGGQRILPTTYKLGQQFVTITGDGTAPFSTDHGYLPGWNPMWQANNYAGNYDVLLYSGSTSTGIAPTSTPSGVVSPWPNTQTQTNPFRQYVYASDESTGSVYQLELENYNGVTHLKVTSCVNGASEITTGPYTLLSYAGLGKLAADPVTGWGSHVPYTGTNSTPVLYMYTNSKIVAQETNAYAAWTDAGVTPEQQHMDISSIPSLATVTAYGTFLNTPCLGQNGVLEFTNSGNLVPGTYELTVVSGQVGQADADFAGFIVDINVNDTVIQRRLLRGKSGYNFAGTDVYQFALEGGATGQWLLSFDWLNEYTDESKGTKRQLAVYSYRLKQVVTELFKVSIGASLSIAQLYTDAYTSGKTPGGWFNTINSYGANVGYAHESDIYTSNDTVEAVYPLGDTLTGFTNERRNDVIYAGADVVVPDSGSFVFPTFSSVGTVSVYNPPLWMWSGGVTGSEATVSARMTYETSQVRVAVSQLHDFGTLHYSAYAHAGYDNGYVAKMRVQGLQPWTRYFYAVENSGSLCTDFTGTFSTFGTGVASFAFGLGACEDNTLGSTFSNPLWAQMAAKKPLFLMHMGDFHYYNINTNDISAFRTAYTAVLGESTHKTFYSQHAVDYVYDDHDYGGNDSDTTAASKPAARQAYRETVPHYSMAAGNGSHAIYHAFDVGRCRFIVTDNRSERTPYWIADNPTKTVLGSEQKKWFKQQLLEANADPNVAVAFWVNSFPWSGTAKPGASPAAENWAAYPTERAEIATFIKDNGVQSLFILSGDMHACAFDDGRTFDFSVDGTNPIITVADGYVGHGIPVFQAAPFYQHNSEKGTPYLIEPMVVIGKTAQFGIVTVKDYGSNVFIDFTGYDGYTGAVLNQDYAYMTYTLNGTASPRP